MSLSLLNLDLLQYYQMRNVVIVLQKKRLIRSQLTKFENLLESGAFLVNH